MNINPEEIYNRLDSVGQEWVAANAKAELLSEAQKSELSTLSLEYLENAKSMTEAETRARADQRYKNFIIGMVKAKEEANECKVRYEAAKAWFEALRSQHATLRQEMKTMPHRA